MARTKSQKVGEYITVSLFKLQKTISEIVSRSITRSNNAVKLYFSNPNSYLFKRVARRIREVVRQSIFKNITGEPAIVYAPLSPKYEKWKKKRYPGAPILQLTGKSKKKFKVYMEVDQKIDKFGRGVLYLSFNVKSMPHYMRFHTTGTSRMPKRDWRVVHDWVRKEIRTILNENDES